MITSFVRFRCDPAGITVIVPAVVTVLTVVATWQKSQVRLLLSTCFTWLFAVCDPAAPEAYTGQDLPAWSPWQPSHAIGEAFHAIVRNVDGADAVPALFTLPELWQ